MEFTYDTVIAAITSLYNNTDPNSINNANKYLSSYQVSFNAWNISNQILLTANLNYEIYFSAASTLHSKIIVDYYDINNQLVVSLKETLFTHLKTFANANTPLRVQIALCISALIIQYQDWENPILELVNKFANSETALILLDILCEVTEECNNERYELSKNLHENTLRRISLGSNSILTLLYTYLQSSGTNIDIQNRVLKCLYRWANFGGLPTSQLIESPLVPLAFDALHQHKLFESAAGAICKFLQHCDGQHFTSPLVQILLPRVASLSPLLEQAFATRDDTLAEGLCRIFSDAGESFPHWMLKASPEAKLLFELILKSSTFPKREVAEYAFPFWYRLSGYYADLSDQDAKDHAVHELMPYFARHLEILTNLVCYPEDYDPTDLEDVESFKSFRYACADSMQDIGYLIGSANTLNIVLQIVSVKFDNYKNSPNNGSIQLEGALYLIRAVARVMESDDITDPRIGELLRISSILPPNDYKLRYTMSLIIGRYSFWLKNNIEMLKELTHYIVGGLSLPEVQSAAALALKNICEPCGEIISSDLPFLSALFKVYESIHTLAQLDQVEIIQGFAGVVSFVRGYDNQLQMLGQLLTPQVNILHGIVTEFGTHVKSGGKHDHEHFVTPFVKCLDRITAMIPRLEFSLAPNQPVHPLIHLFDQLWPIITDAFHFYQNYEICLEKLTKLYKNIIRLTKGYSLSIVSNLLKLMLESFIIHPHSCFIYTTGVCVEIFGSDLEQSQMFAHYLNEYSKLVLPKLNNSHGFVEYPDIAEDYYYLVIEFLLHSPSLLITSQRISSIFESALHGMLTQHKESYIRIANALRLLVWNACAEHTPGGNDLLDNGETRVASRLPRSAETIAHYRNLVLTQGQTIINNIVFSMAGAIPTSRYSLMHGVFEGMLLLSNEHVKQWLMQALSDPNILANEQAKSAIYNALIGTHSGVSISGARRKRLDAVHEFANICKKNSRQLNKN